MIIPFNKVSITGNELKYINESINTGSIQGDGKYTKLCTNYFDSYYGFKKNLLVSSCTTALDLASIIIDIKPGDEVIMPSYTFVSTANAFVSRGAKVKFIDIRKDTLNIDENKIEEAITKNTRAIIPVHYAGVSCEMDKIVEIGKKNNLLVIEDAAQGLSSKYKGKYLGGIGDFGAISFHGTKNYTSGGEGGLFIVKDEDDFARAEIIREKGTNRSVFLKGEVDKYTWVDIGHSLLPSDLSAAYLFAQLENNEVIKSNRIKSWNFYMDAFKSISNSMELQLPFVPDECDHNAHLFYIVFPNGKIRDNYIQHMKKIGVTTPFHYVPLHSSPAGKKFGEFVGDDKHTTKIADSLVRLPLFYNMHESELNYIVEHSYKFFA